MSNKAGIWVTFAVASVTIACSPTRQQQADIEGERATAIQPDDATARSRIDAVEDYVVGGESYLVFRQQAWPSFTILHMDVRAGAPETADAVVVLGTAGGSATAGGEAEQQVENALGIVDERGLCIVRGWLDGQRYVAAIASECPQPVRQELEGILGDFDALTGGDAIWLLRFEQGLLQSKRRL